MDNLDCLLHPFHCSIEVGLILSTYLHKEAKFINTLYFEEELVGIFLDGHFLHHSKVPAAWAGNPQDINDISHLSDLQTTFSL